MGRQRGPSISIGPVVRRSWKPLGQSRFIARLPGAIPRLVAAAKFADDVAGELFGVAEKHHGVVEVIQRIVDSGETSGQARSMATRLSGFRRLAGGGHGLRAEGQGGGRLRR